MGVPFEKVEELNSQLRIKTSSPTPFLERTGTTSACTLPGNPLQPLQSVSLHTFLLKDLETPKLDRLAPHLWLIATPSSSSISPLHHQIVRGRHITLTENPDLHLVWIRDRVFLKPIPPYLLSHDFWMYCFGHQATFPEAQTTLHKSCLGFLRSYFHLIKHESDFRLAVKHHLVPSTTTFEAYCQFIRNFADVDEYLVSPRYRYGELRLTRLNFWSKLFLGQFKFEEVAGQYEEYFARFYGPLLFVFGMFSVFLSAMQVGLAAEPQPSPSSAWVQFFAASKWSAVAILLIVASLGVSLLLLLLYMVSSELIFALRHREEQINKK
jgi:hypothetical protein